VTGLDGTLVLTRLALRRDRLRLTVWVVALVGLTYLSGTAMASAFPTQRSIEAYGRSVTGSPALIAMTGPPLGLNTLAGIVLNKVALTAIIGVCLVVPLTVVRHTRTEEEEGRTELLRATVVGRHAGSAAATLVAWVVSVLLGGGTALALVGSQVPPASAWLFGAGVSALGVVFAAIALVAAQLFVHARAALGLTLGVLALSLVVRAIGDVRHDWLVWLSPIGWSQATHVLGDERWWPLLVPVGVAVVLVAAAVALTDRRDAGAGLVAPRPGPAQAPASLSGALGLSWRLQRAGVLGWAAGVLLLSLAMGSLSGEVDSMARDNPSLGRYLRAGGAGSLRDSYVATMLLLMALVAGAFAVSSAMRMRGEESSGRLECLLATGLSRPRWLLASSATTAGGTLLLLLLAGTGLGVADAVVRHDAGSAARLAGLGLVYGPAALCLVAVSVLVVGWVPRAVAAAWAALGGCVVLGWLGSLLDPPAWVSDLSPYTHTPGMPAEPLDLVPLVVMGAVAVVLLAVGTHGFRRRDLSGG
jgi:ABC-2 type transport system permease protein